MQNRSRSGKGPKSTVLSFIGFYCDHPCHRINQYYFMSFVSLFSSPLVHS